MSLKTTVSIYGQNVLCSKFKNKRHILMKYILKEGKTHFEAWPVSRNAKGDNTMFTLTQTVANIFVSIFIDEGTKIIANFNIM